MAHKHLAAITICSEHFKMTTHDNNSAKNKLRRLGKNGPLVPAMGFGLMVISDHGYGEVPDNKVAFALLDRAVELGATFWDSSE